MLQQLLRLMRSPYGSGKLYSFVITYYATHLYKQTVIKLVNCEQNALPP